MHIDQINLNLIRVFESVYREKSMSSAAKSLHMSQSGVSQHIKTLESYLNLSLFDRGPQKLIPTQAAEDLYSSSVAFLYNLEKAFCSLKDPDSQSLKGQVRIGMPIEFGNNMVLPAVSQFLAEQPLVNVKIVLGHASSMSELLLTGGLDFAVVDQFDFDKRLLVEKISFEELFLCAGIDYSKKLKAKNIDFTSLDYIAYQEGEPVVRQWLKDNKIKVKKDLNVRAYVMDVQGVAKMIQNNAGVGVLPGHLIRQLKLHSNLYVHKSLKAYNPISVVTLKDRTVSPAAQALKDFVCQWISKKLKKK